MAKDIRHSFTKAVGVTGRNDDGTDRQEILARCVPAETLTLEYEEDNPHDSNAVRLIRKTTAEQVGYLPAARAGGVVRGTAKGKKYAVFIRDVVGGFEGAETLGLRLLMVVAEPGVSDEAVQVYVNDLDINFGYKYLKREELEQVPEQGKGCLTMIAVLALAAAGLFAVL